MLNSFAYVAWIDSKGIGHIRTYWITDKDASGIHPTAEELFNKKCERTNGVITFEFSRPLQPDCQSGQECKNVIDPASALKMVWAMGDEWSGMYRNLFMYNSHPVTHALSLSRPSSAFVRPSLVSVNWRYGFLDGGGFLSKLKQRVRSLAAGN